jgi:hypothetical protein
MILILGSDHYNTTQYYKNLGLSPSVLIDSTYSTYPVAHTSPSAAGEYNALTNIANLADVIYYAYPSENEFDTRESFYEYLLWVKEFNYKTNKIKNLSHFNHNYFKWSEDIPLLRPNDAVFLGCSFTQGAGISDKSQRYSNIISNYFNLRCINLARSGASNSYSFETFSKLDLHPGQLVILQLSVLERIRYCDSKRNLQHLRFSSGVDPAIVEVFNYEHLFYELLIKLNLVCQIAKSKNIKLVIWAVNYNSEFGQTFSSEQQISLCKYESLVPIFLTNHYIVDFGTDNAHPGPESNKKIAKILIDFIEKNYTK